MSHIQVQQKILYHLNEGHQGYTKYIYEKYLNTEEIDLFMREFYSESSSWFTNTEIESMKNTIHWPPFFRQSLMRIRLLVV